MRTLIVKDYGIILRFRKGLIVVDRKSGDKCKVPLSAVDQILLLTGGILVSSKLMRIASRNGIEIVILDSRGNPCARLVPPYHTRTVMTKRLQYEAYNNEKGVELAKAFVMGKILNQSGLLKYLARNRSNIEVKERIYRDAIEVESFIELVREVNASRIESVRMKLMGIEAEAAKVYWRCIASILPSELNFPGRVQESNDVFNKLLNYGYGVLKSYVWRAILLAGLDPYAGLLHADRSGRPSLVLDLMEEFRQPVVDRTLIALTSTNLKLVLNSLEEDGRIKKEVRARIVTEIVKRMNTNVRYEMGKVPLERAVLRQARRIARYLRGQENYRPYVERW